MDDNDDEIRRRLDRSFESWLNLRRIYKLADTDEHRHGAASLVLMGAAEIISYVCGEDLVRDAYLGPSGQAPSSKAEILLTVAHRLRTASALFGRLETRDQDGATLLQVADEAAMVAAGDDPQIFVRIGEKRNIREARLRQRALEWEAYLQGLGLESVILQNAISSAFGAPWDTIRRWDEVVIRNLGQGSLDEARRWARACAKRGDPLFGASREGTWEAALVEDGQRYRNCRKSRAR